MIGSDILLLEDIQRLLDQALEPEPSVVISAGGVIREGYDEQLDQLRRFSRDASSLLTEMEETERTNSGISGLKLGYNRVHGYYFEISTGLAGYPRGPNSFSEATDPQECGAIYDPRTQNI